MSHVTISQGASKDHEIEIKVNGELTDPDSNSVTPVIVSPASGSNPPTVGSATRVSQGIYKVTITVLANTTLTKDLDTGEDWQIRYDFTVSGGATIDADKRTFSFTVIDPATVSESGTWTTPDAVRRGFLDRDELIDGKTGTTLTLGSMKAVEVISLKKNGTTLTQVSSSPTTNQYSFTRPRTITLGDAAMSADVFEIYLGTYFDDDRIQEFIDEIHEVLEGKLRTIYSIPFTSTPPLLAKVERWTTQWAIIVNLQGHEQFRIPASQQEIYEKRYRDCQDIMRELIEGDRQLEDANGEVISRLSIATDDEAFIAHKSSATGGDEYSWGCH